MAAADLPVELAAHGLTDVRLSPEIETVVYRAVQESLTNVARHACATPASIMVIVSEGRLRALIEDDGSGSMRPRCRHADISVWWA